MDIINIRNNIVFENILPFIDLQTTLKLSAACKNWYDRINTYSKLWKRLMKKENIEDPERWDWLDDEGKWPLGIPCKEKKIIMNYRRTDFCLKNNICKTVDLTYAYRWGYSYDGKTFVFIDGQVLRIYKIINNSFKLFQSIEPYKVGNVDGVYTNTKYIVTYQVKNDNNIDVMSYRLLCEEYVSYHQLSIELETLNFDVILDSDIFIITTDLSFCACNIPQNTIIFNGTNHKFLEYYNNVYYFIVDPYNDPLRRLVAYSEELEIISEVNIAALSYGKIYSSLLESDHILLVVTLDKDICVFTWHTATGQTKIESKLISNALLYNCIIADDKIFMFFDDGNGSGLGKLGAFNCKTFCSLWQIYLDDDSYTELSFCFNKLFVARPYSALVEIRDPDSGDVLYTIQTVYQHMFEVNKDMIIYKNEGNSGFTIELYR